MLKEYTDQQKWDELVATSNDGGLLQSWAWGEFQEALYNGVYRVGNDNWVAQCFQLKAGNHWIMYCPRGPVSIGDGSGLDEFLSELQSFAKEHMCFMLRFDPAWESSANIEVKADKAKRERQPVHTLIIDTDKSEEEILENMKPKWRYNIRLAEKKGATFRWSSSLEDAKHFYNLVSKTTQRQAFGAYDEDYYATLMEHLGKKDQAKFLLAEYEGKIIAGLLIGFFGKRSYYLHGASDYEHRNLMAPHLLQWEAIKEAKRRGMDYDLWGVATDPPSNKQEAAWGGVTRFKKGFAPKKELVEYAGTYELPVKKLWYTIYKLRQLTK